MRKNCRFFAAQSCRVSEKKALLKYEASNTLRYAQGPGPCRRKARTRSVEQPAGWTPPSILRPPEVLTESELVEADAELKALQRHAFEIVDPPIK